MDRIFTSNENSKIEFSSSEIEPDIGLSVNILQNRMKVGDRYESYAQIKSRITYWLDIN